MNKVHIVCIGIALWVLPFSSVPSLAAGVQLAGVQLTSPAAGLAKVEEHPSSAESWKHEFERICSQTEISGSLDADQLEELISAADRLLILLSEKQDPQLKIYRFRLRNCREFLDYARQLKAQRR